MTSFFMIFLITILVSFQPSEAKNATDDSTQLQTYIVQLRAPNHLLNDKQKRESWYASLLSQIGSDPHHRLVHSYHHVFPGFAAMLTPDEFEALQHLEGVVSAWPDEMNYPHTTHSPRFMGLQLNRSAGGQFWRKSDYGLGVIIGVLDSGINADGHLSFKDHRYPPKGWNGKCKAPIKCNNKLIGVKSFVGGSPKDDYGHGSHVAGIAAGNFMKDANVHGEGDGTRAQAQDIFNVGSLSWSKPKT